MSNTYSYGYPTLFKSTSHAERHLQKDDSVERINLVEDPSGLNISQGMGTVVEYYEGKEDSLVVHIQDRHADPIAQLNIADIIAELVEKHDVHLMCLEGASSELDTTFYDQIPDSSIKDKVAKFFVEKGLFTGSEYYKITNAEKYLKAQGAEDKQVYLEHLASYKDNIVDKGRILEFLGVVDISINILKDKIFSEQLKALDKKADSYSSRLITLPEYLKTVQTYSRKLKINTSRYDNLSRFIELVDKEEKIDFEKAEAQRETLVKRLSDILEKEKLDILVANSLQFRLGKMSQGEFYDYLRTLMGEAKLNEAGYSELIAYCDYIEFSKSINHLMVFDEVETLEGKIKVAMCKSAIQEDLVNYSKAVKMLKDLYGLKLTSKQLDYMGNAQEYFNLPAIQRFLKNTYKQYGLDLSPVVLSTHIDQKAIDASKEYYQIALKRDIALVDNTLSNMKKYRKTKSILITGGFHTSGITNILKEREVSYIVICPNIGAEDCEQIYSDRMAGKLPGMAELAEFFNQMLVTPLITADASREEIVTGAKVAFAMLCGLAQEMADLKAADISWQRLSAERKEAILGSIEEALRGRGVLSLQEVQTVVRQSVMDARMGALPTRLKASSAGNMTREGELDFDTRFDVWANIFSDNPEMAPTPRAEAEEDNRFIKFTSQNTDKTQEQTLQELDALVRRHHYRMYTVEGFITPSESEESRKVQDVFNRIVAAYNTRAGQLGLPNYGGKLFIVDSSEVNAFVFAEHSDVYIYSGLIRELAHYAERLGIEFSEDLIAGVLAHEMTHVMQHSSFEGIPWGSEKEMEAYLPELLELKRRAEYHADEGGLSLLSIADYNPEAMVHVVDFLSKMTQQGTTEYSVASHPHPKERVANLEIVMEDEIKVFPNWNKDFTPLDTQQYLNLGGKHVGAKINGIKSLSDVRMLIEEADTIEEVLELIKIAKYMEQRIVFLQFMSSPEAQEAFAMELYIRNVIQAMQDIVARATEGSEPFLPAMKTVSQEGLFLERILQNETQSPPQRDRLFRGSGNSYRLKWEKMKDKFEKEAAEIIKRVNKSLLDADEKLRIISILRNMVDLGSGSISAVGRNANESLEMFMRSDPERQYEYEQIVNSLLSGNLEAMSTLRSHPFALYRVYGQEVLTDEFKTKDILKAVAGERLRGVDLGTIRIERSPYAFYERNIRLLPIATEEERRRLFNVIMMPMLYEMSRFGIHEYYSVKSEDGTEEKGVSNSGDKLFNHFYSEGMEGVVYQAIMRTAPEMETAQAQSVKQWFAEFISGKNRDLDRSEAVNKYVMAMIPMLPPDIFTSIFSNEYSANESMRRYSVFSTNLPDEIDADRAKWLELNDKRKEVAQFILTRVKDKDPKEQVEFIKKTISQFTSLFRQSIIVALYNDSKNKHSRLVDDARLSFSCAQWLNIMKGQIHPQDAFKLIQEIILAEEENYIQSLNREQTKATLEVYQWIIKNKPKFEKLIADRVLGEYLNLRLRMLEFLAIEELGLNAEDIFDKEKRGKIEEKAQTYLSTEQAFDLIHEIADHNILEFVHPHDMTPNREKSGYNKSDLIKDEIDQLWREAGSKEISSQKIPLSIFVTPSTHLEQYLFRKLFDFNEEQLKTLAEVQTRVRDRLSIKRGRLTVKVPESKLNKVLDILILAKVLKKSGFPRFNISSSNFEEIMTGKIRKRQDYSGEDRVVFLLSTLDVKDLSETILNHLGFVDYGSKYLDGVSSDLAFTRMRDFFEQLRNSGFMGRYWESDTFLRRLSMTDHGLRLFPLYAGLMSDMQFPEIDEKELEASEERRHYLEVLARSVKISGLKADLFADYNKEYTKLLESVRPIEERLADLLKFLEIGTLYRDGFIDHWERALIPEVGLNWAEQKGLAFFLSRREGLLKDAYQDFELTAMSTPLQWEKVKTAELAFSTKRAKEALDFYRRTIPHVFDPQRQLRMGATAIRILRNSFPDVSFQEEFEAIKAFFPNASEMRDAELQRLLDRHTVPNLEGGITRGSLDEVMLLFKSFQDMEYDEEVTNANMIENMIKAISASASREDRMEVLFWVLEPEESKTPRVIQEADDKFNVDFEELPYHASFLSEEYRVKIIQQFLLGENGLFNPQTENDNKMMDEFVDRLFLYFFPPHDDKKRRASMRDKKRYLEQEVYEFMREMFPIVMREYSPARRTSIALSLLRLHEEINNLSEGERLAEILSAIGPVGVKLGQYLSENQNLIPNDKLRSDLGSLKGRAAPISKLGIIDTLIQEGFDMSRIRIGRLLGSASMKQVHAGWFLDDEGNWREVVIKVLRPKIHRVIESDITILKNIVKYLGEKYDRDVGDVVKTIEKWIRLESDFRNEAKNVKVVDEAIELYYEAYPERTAEGRKIKTPKVYVGNNASVMIEEKVPGIEIGQLFETAEVHKESGELATIEELMNQGYSKPEAEEAIKRNLRRRLTKQDLITKGFSEKEAEEILSLDENEMIEQLRDMLLFQIFDAGKAHADLHSDNTMSGPGSDYFIDMGLVMEINERQREGAKGIIVGVMTHNAKMIFEGMKIMHLEGGKVSQGERGRLETKLEESRDKALKDMRAIFRQRLDIKSEINEIAARILEENLGEASDDFSIFMKAMTQAIWLFPTDVFKALDTLNALADKFDLKGEKYRAMLIHGWPSLKRAIAISYLNRRGRYWARINARLSPVRTWWDRNRRYMRNVKMFKKTTEDVREVEKILDVVTTENKYKLAEHIKPVGGAAIPVTQITSNAGEFVTHNINELPVEVDDNQLRLIAGYDKLSPQEKENVKRAIMIYYRIFTFLNDSGSRFNLRLNEKEKMFLEAYTLREFGQPIEAVQVVARILTARVMKEISRQENSAYYDFIAPASPPLRALGELWADAHLASVGADFAHRFTNIEAISGSTRVTISEGALKANQLVISRERQGSDLKVKYTKKKEQALGQKFQSKPIKTILLSNKDQLIPGNIYKGSDGKFALLALRTGYTSRGRFELDLIDLERHDAVHLSLTEKQYNAFLKGESLESMIQESWGVSRLRKGKFVAQSLESSIEEGIRSSSLGPVSDGAKASSAGHEGLVTSAAQGLLSTCVASYNVPFYDMLGSKMPYSRGLIIDDSLLRDDERVRNVLGTFTDMAASNKDRSKFIILVNTTEARQELIGHLQAQGLFLKSNILTVNDFLKNNRMETEGLSKNRRLIEATKLLKRRCVPTQLERNNGGSPVGIMAGPKVDVDELANIIKQEGVKGVYIATPDPSDIIIDGKSFDHSILFEALLADLLIKIRDYNPQHYTYEDLIMILPPISTFEQLINTMQQLKSTMEAVAKAA